jgi:hypothetical protein
MSPIAPDAPTPRPLTFAFPLSDGRWRVHRGSAHLLDGRLRAIEVPSLGTRSGPGETGGLSAVFFVVYGVKGRRGARTGTVTRWEVEDGCVTRTEEAAINVELVE